MAPKSMIHEVQSVDVPLGPGRQTLRITLARAENGGPVTLILAAGFGGADSGEGFHRPHWAGSPIQLPGEALPALREALAALAEGESTPVGRAPTP